MDAITSLAPFSLADVVRAAGEIGPDIEYRYKGQTQHHRIIRTIAPEHEPLWRSFLAPGTEPVVSAATVVEDHGAEAARREAETL